MEHIIISNLTKFKRKKLNSPEGYNFDRKLGAWISNEDRNEILVKAKDRPIRGTKKNDIETGEDLKSE